MIDIAFSRSERNGRTNARLARGTTICSPDKRLLGRFTASHPLSKLLRAKICHERLMKQ
jgi:hypothetical protein